MAEKRTIRGSSKKKVRVKSKKKVAPLSKQQTFHISKSAMSWMICKPTNVTIVHEVLNQQELEDFEL